MPSPARLSEWHTPHASIRIRTSPGDGSASSRVTRANSRFPVTTIARYVGMAPQIVSKSTTGLSRSTKDDVEDDGQKAVERLGGLHGSVEGLGAWFHRAAAGDVRGVSIFDHVKGGRDDIKAGDSRLCRCEVRLRTERLGGRRRTHHVGATKSTARSPARSLLRNVSGSNGTPTGFLAKDSDSMNATPSSAVSKLSTWSSIWLPSGST